MALPPLQRSTTPNSFKLKKSKAKSITPVLSVTSTERNYVILNSGRKFTLYMAVCLKNVFDGVKDESGGASAILVARGVRDFPEIKKLSESLEDLGIIHSKVSFDEVIKICCSGAFQP